MRKFPILIIITDLRVETERFLAPNCKATICNNAHKKLLIPN